MAEKCLGLPAIHRVMSSEASSLSYTYAQALPSLHEKHEDHLKCSIMI